MEKIGNIEYNLNQIQYLYSKIDSSEFPNFIKILNGWISTNLGFPLCPFSKEQLEKIMVLYFNGSRGNEIFLNNFSMDFKKQELFSELIKTGCVDKHLFVPFLSFDCLIKLSHALIEGVDISGLYNEYASGEEQERLIELKKKNPNEDYSFFCDLDSKGLDSLLDDISFGFMNRCFEEKNNISIEIKKCALEISAALGDKIKL